MRRVELGVSQVVKPAVVPGAARYGAWVRGCEDGLR
jgi:hypothetical protein